MFVSLCPIGEIKIHLFICNPAFIVHPLPLAYIFTPVAKSTPVALAPRTENMFSDLDADFSSSACQTRTQCKTISFFN